MVNLIIDGKSVEVLEGTTVLRAAEQAEIYIPTLCNHPQLTPYGGCRLCMVEVEGARILQPSCTLPVTPGMVVKTNTEKVIEARKFVLTLIFSERNHFCMYCQVSNGDCELQNAAYDEDMTHWPLQPNWHPFEVDASHPFFVLDNNRCILCRRCTRACGELVGNYTLGFEERGANSFLVADYGVPLGESTCISCGTCVQICPTGALIDRRSAYQGKITEVEHHSSVCMECSVGCQRDILTRDNRLVRIEGNWDAPMNHGLLCDKGRFIPLEEQPARITTPLVRKEGALKAATWEEAIDVIVQNLQPQFGKKENGVAALASTRLTIEALAQFESLFNHGKSQMVAMIDEDTTAYTATKVAEKLGQSFEANLQSVKDADVALVIGTDLVSDHQVAGFFIKRQQFSGMKLIVADNKNNKLMSKADTKIILSNEDGTEFAKLLTVAVSDNAALKNLCEHHGVDSTVLEDTVKLLSEAMNPVIIYGGNFTSTLNFSGLEALVEFSSKVGAKLLGTKGKANSLAAALLGFEVCSKLASPSAAFIALGDDVPSQKLTKELENVPFVAVQTAYISQLSGKANVVLPAVIWAEEEGHYLSLDGHIQFMEKALVHQEGILKTSACLNLLAEKMGVKVETDWLSRLHSVTSPVVIKAE